MRSFTRPIISRGEAAVIAAIGGLLVLAIAASPLIMVVLLPALAIGWTLLATSPVMSQDAEVLGLYGPQGAAYSAHVAAVRHAEERSLLPPILTPQPATRKAAPSCPASSTNGFARMW